MEVWRPDTARILGARITAFKEWVRSRHGVRVEDFADLQRFALDNPGQFWRSLGEFCGFRAEWGQAGVLSSSFESCQFFPDTRLNYAQNLLSSNGSGEAVIFRSENGDRSSLSWDELRRRTACLNRYFSGTGLDRGQCVAALMPNMPETVLAMLATSSRGAIWASCSPDFGVDAIISRFGQITPHSLVVCDGYFYKGRRIDISDKVVSIVEQLPTLERVLVVPYLGTAEELVDRIGEKAILFDTLFSGESSGFGNFVQVGFNDPLYVLFSSGTTGKPKCIVHGAGGTLLQHHKEHQLHCDFRAGDRLFYFTTCGWMMWNWMVSALASGVTLLLYDGSPFHPSERVLFDYLEAERATCFGTSAKYIDSLRKVGLKPSETHDLSALRTILSTGSALTSAGFDYVYENIKKDVHLASISGGTDICGCFVMGDPTRPVYRGEIQGPALGMDVRICDHEGRFLETGKGELVCARPFPSMPVFFWNDANGEKYRRAYFESFPGVWDQGDFAEWTEHGGIIIHGRSDTTLNPGGVRIGTGELYAQLDEVEWIRESVIVSQQWGDDTRIVLFVKLATGEELTDEMRREIRNRIAGRLSPRHVPEKIVSVPDVPRTRSGKISETAVRDVIHGRDFPALEGLENPESLAWYRDLEALRS